MPEIGVGHARVLELERGLEVPLLSLPTWRGSGLQAIAAYE